MKKVNQFHYPVRVIKNKIKSPNYKPLIVDCTTGHAIAQKSGKAEKVWFNTIKGLFSLTSVAFIYFILLSPVIETAFANSEVNSSIQEMSAADKNTLNNLRQTYTVVAETKTNAIVNIILKVDKPYTKEVLGKAFSLDGLKEVYTDGTTVSISFVTSDND